MSNVGVRLSRFHLTVLQKLFIKSFHATVLMDLFVPLADAFRGHGRKPHECKHVCGVFEHDEFPLESPPTPLHKTNFNELLDNP